MNEGGVLGGWALSPLYSVPMLLIWDVFGPIRGQFSYFSKTILAILGTLCGKYWPALQLSLLAGLGRWDCSQQRLTIYGLRKWAKIDQQVPEWAPNKPK